MATRKPKTTDAPEGTVSAVQTDSAGTWQAPKGAQTIELSEFFNFGRKGETVVGRIQRYTTRPDPNHADKMMGAIVLSPALVFVPGGKPEAYKTMAVGHSAHLQLLISDVPGEVGNAYAIQYDGTRPSEVKGRQPSKQFNVFKLSAEQFVAQVREVAGKHADALLGEVDDLPF